MVLLSEHVGFSTLTFPREGSASQSDGVIEAWDSGSLCLCWSGSRWEGRRAV